MASTSSSATLMPIFRNSRFAYKLPKLTISCSLHCLASFLLIIGHSRSTPVVNMHVSETTIIGSYSRNFFIWSKTVKPRTTLAAIVAFSNTATLSVIRDRTCTPVVGDFFVEPEYLHAAAALHLNITLFEAINIPASTLLLHLPIRRRIPTWY